jgi:hypothetical protein
MTKISSTAIAVFLLMFGFAVVFQAGRTMGFRTGSEWALLQADLIAREAGVFMPVYLEGDKFRVVLKQPRGLYRRAWQMADRYEDQGSVKTVRADEPVKTADSNGRTTF